MHHLAYFVEAVLLGRQMRRREIGHVHASFSATVALITTRIFPVTMSFGVYGYGELHDPRRSHLTERIACALFVRSISRNGRGQLMLWCDQKEWSKLHYVALGIDPAEFPPRSGLSTGSRIGLLCVGRLAPEKGQIFLLHAIAKLKNAATPLHLYLVGDGPDRARLEREASRLGVAGNVSFEGAVDVSRLAELYGETDVFVLPSLAEGIPIAAMEAMAKAIPCVAPRIAGIPELIDDGVDGMLFHVADVEDLVRAIRTLIDSAELRLQMGRRARLRVERDYNIKRNTEKFADLLRQQLPAIEH
jgi:glycosyltransferase involved in cell wall biosynthesis